MILLRQLSDFRIPWREKGTFKKLDTLVFFFLPLGKNTFNYLARGFCCTTYSLKIPKLLNIWFSCFNDKKTREWMNAVLWTLFDLRVCMTGRILHTRSLPLCMGSHQATEYTCGQMRVQWPVFLTPRYKTVFPHWSPCSCNTELELLQNSLPLFQWLPCNTGKALHFRNFLLSQKWPKWILPRGLHLPNDDHEF